MLMAWRQLREQIAAFDKAMRALAKSSPTCRLLMSVPGLDIAKRVFQVHGVDAAGRPVLRRKLQRDDVFWFFKGLPTPCLIGIEACGTAHYWAREITALGHEVRLLPPSTSSPTSSAARRMQPMPRQSARQ